MSVRDNCISLFVDARLLTVINGEAGNKKQRNATYIMALLVEHSKNSLSPETYEELKLRYSKTAEEQKIEKNIREREKLEQRKKELELKERELTLREQNAKVFQKQTTITENKAYRELKREIDRKTKPLKERLEDAELSLKRHKEGRGKPLTPESLEYWQNEVKRLKAEIEKLEAPIKMLESQLTAVNI